MYPAGLVLESAFTSMPELAAYHAPWPPARWLAYYDLGTEAALARAAWPPLIARSPDDGIAPSSHANAHAAVRPDTTRRVHLSRSHNDPPLAVDEARRSARGDCIQNHAARQ